MRTDAETGRLKTPPLAAVLSRYATAKSFDDLATAVRDLLPLRPGTFSYQVWLADAFSDGRPATLFIAFDSGTPPLPRRRYGTPVPDEVLAAAEPSSAPSIVEAPRGGAFSHRAFTRIAYADDYVGVLAISLSSASEAAELAPHLSRLSGECYLLFRPFFLGVESRLFAELKRSFAYFPTHKERVHALVDAVKEAFSAEGCSLFYYDSASRRLFLESTTGLFAPKSATIHYTLGEGLTGWVAAEKRPLRLYNIDDADELRAVSPNLHWESKYSELSAAAHPPPIEWGSYLAVPVLIPGPPEVLLGVIRLSRRDRGDVFLPQEERLLREVARFLARYYEEHHLKESFADYRFLRRIGLASIAHRTDTPGLDRLWRRVLERLRNVGESRTASLFLKSERSRRWQAVASIPWQTSPPAPPKDLISTLECSSQRDGASRGPQVRGGLVLFDELETNPPLGPRTTGYLPFRVRRELVGLCVFGEMPAGPLSPFTRRRLAEIADAAALFVDYSNRLSATAERLESVTQVLESYTDYQNPESLYAAGLSGLCRLLHASCAALLEYDETRQNLTVIASSNYDHLDTGFTVAVGEGLTGQAAARRKTVYWRVGSDEAQASPIAIDPNLVEEEAWPVLLRDQLLGCVCVGSGQPGLRRVQEGELHLADLLTQQLAVAMHLHRLWRNLDTANQARTRAARRAELGLMVGQLAHDLNNRVATLLEAVEALDLPSIRSSGRDASRSAVASIEAQSAGLRDLMAALLARVADKQLAPDWHFVNDILRRTLLVVQPHALQRRVRLVPRFDPALDRPKAGVGHPFFCDFTRLDQAFENLIRNAIDHSYPRGVVSIVTRFEPAGSRSLPDEIVVAVQDNGEGITEDVRPRIFEHGFSTKPGGQGIGLTVARDFTMAYAGSITLESRPRKETTFTVRFQVVEEK